MLLITHDLGVVVEVCTKVAVIYSGQIIECGTVEDVYARKNNHPYTEGLFNCIPDLKSNAARADANTRKHARSAGASQGL